MALTRTHHVPRKDGKSTAFILSSLTLENLLDKKSNKTKVSKIVAGLESANIEKQISSLEGRVGVIKDRGQQIDAFIANYTATPPGTPKKPLPSFVEPFNKSKAELVRLEEQLRDLRTAYTKARAGWELSADKITELRNSKSATLNKVDIENIDRQKADNTKLRVQVKSVGDSMVRVESNIDEYYGNAGLKRAAGKARSTEVKPEQQPPSLG